MLSKSITAVGRWSAVSALTLLLSFAFGATAQDKNPGHSKLDGPLNSVSQAFGQGGAAGAQASMHVDELIGTMPLGGPARTTDRQDPLGIHTEGIVSRPPE